ncbi:MAG: TIR domain-containing protein [candidate division KSB1 bacterium]|nr:TIR domain-containing protein [candidate division KSB1 bacterium]MDZ7302134.1 TIR domain-containing protein [candidate division KSB1 bacterium]MDZ7311244.1 TIR domain-containing protein [candidate division KSB1 bacterium]
MQTRQKTDSPKIFISYAWENQSFARQLQESFREAGAEVFVDYTGIKAGESLPSRISAALRWCDTLVLLWSQHAATSHWVELEWTSGIALNLHLIPCRLDKTPLPEILWGKRYIDFTDFDRGFEELLAAVGLEKAAPVSLSQSDVVVSTPPEQPKTKRVAKPVASPSFRQPSITLRAQPQEELTPQAVKTMLKQYDFYCAYSGWNKEWSNPQGQGIKHAFDLQQEGKVVVDHATGLMWQQSGSSNYMIYANAEKYIRDLNNKLLAGYNDWRLPTLEEAMSLMEPKKHGELYIDPIFDHNQRWIWTADKESAGRAWYVNFVGGACGPVDGGYDVSFVRAVRP